MPRSSAPESGPPGSSRERAIDGSGSGRAQTEPFAALVAVVVVGLALALYAGAFEQSLPKSVDRNAAEPAADRVERALTVGGVVRPGRLDGATAVGPEGYDLNVTVVVDGHRESVGPAPPGHSDNATRRVSVFRGPGTVVAGRLEVRVWT